MVVSRDKGAADEGAAGGLQECVEIEHSWEILHTAPKMLSPTGPETEDTNSDQSPAKVACQLHSSNQPEEGAQTFNYQDFPVLESSSLRFGMGHLLRTEENEQERGQWTTPPPSRWLISAAILSDRSGPYSGGYVLRRRPDIVLRYELASPERATADPATADERIHRCRGNSSGPLLWIGSPPPSDKGLPNGGSWCSRRSRSPHTQETGIRQLDVPTSVPGDPA